LKDRNSIKIIKTLKNIVI